MTTCTRCSSKVVVVDMVEDAAEVAMGNENKDVATKVKETATE